MSSGRDKRISRLEQKRKPRAKVIVAWRNTPAESDEQAIARRCPKGVPANASLIVCSWQDPAPSDRPPPAR